MWKRERTSKIRCFTGLLQLSLLAAAVASAALQSGDEAVLQRADEAALQRVDQVAPAADPASAATRGWSCFSFWRMMKLSSCFWNAKMIQEWKNKKTVVKLCVLN